MYFCIVSERFIVNWTISLLNVIDILKHKLNLCLVIVPGYLGYLTFRPSRLAVHTRGGRVRTCTCAVPADTAPSRVTA